MSLESLAALFDKKPAATNSGAAGTTAVTDEESDAVNRIIKVFTDGLPAVFPGWESRKQQIEMAKTIALAFKRGQSALTEAGTGTGKSLAILANAVAMAKDIGRPVIISTGTHVLQSQYIEKDVPILKQAIGEFDVTLAKGKGNYLCLQRLENETQSLITTPAIDEIADWAESTVTGDRSDLPAHLTQAWSTVNVDDTCTKAKCPLYADCFYYQAKARMLSAQVIIVNHALLMADIVVRRNSFGNASLLPEPAAIIIDEAHHLESVARQALGVSIAQTRLNRILSDVVKAVPGINQILVDQADRFNNSLFGQIAIDIGGERAEFSPSEEASRLVDELNDTLKELNKELEVAKRRAATEHQEGLVGAMIDRINQYKLDLDDILVPEKGHAVWGEVDRRSGQVRVTIHSTPVEPADTIKYEVFDRAPVVCSSATLTTNRNFNYYRSQVGAPDGAMEFICDSPFDYDKNALLYVPRNLPDPRSDSFHKQISNEVLGILNATKGRAFVLCTSWRGMNELYEAISSQVGLRCMRQGEMPHGQIIDVFKRDTNSVLFATASFWEGVDVQGDALSCVILDKLPFAVPTDPITRAKVKAIEARGGNAFMDYSVPEAVLKMRQGFGRLIRSQSDRGVVAVMDRRIIEGRYGRIFLNSLPPARMVRDLIHVKRFFGEGEAA